MTDTLTETTEARPFALGDRVTYATGGRDYTGTVSGIFTPEEGYPSLWVAGSEHPNDYSIRAGREGFEADGRAQWDDSVALTDENRGHWVSTRYDSPRLVTDDTQRGTFGNGLERASEEERSHLQALDTITALRAEVSDLESQVETAREVLSIIGRTLQETADLHEWCGEYDRRVSELVDSLPGRYGFDSTFAGFAQRAREYEVCVHWTVTYSTTVSVEASSAEAAVDMVQDSPRDWIGDPCESAYSDDVSWDEVHNT